MKGREEVTMDQSELLAVRFEEHRSHLRTVAYRMLGSLSDADDAVQDTWERVGRAGVIVAKAGRPIAVMTFTIIGDRIVQIHTIADPDRVAELAAPAFGR